jgi:glycosyltransferase involved in cell wall biosynthesis
VSCAAGCGVSIEPGAVRGRGVTLGVSVVIPAYNAAARLHLPLEGLAAQRDVVPVEVVVVDNNSTDGTGQVALDHPATASLRRRGCDVRVVAESLQGLTRARIRGVLEARADLVCFLDDDTVPCSDYVEAGARTFAADRTIGLLVSRVAPRFEEAPRPSIARRAHLLAVNEWLGAAPIVWPAAPTIVPTVGAGLWFRREAFLAAVPWREPERLMTDRSGRALTSGGDIELGVLLGAAGWRRAYSPEVRLEHVIPPSRLEWRYFARLVDGVVRSTLTLEERYGAKPHGLRRRAGSMLGLGGAIFALPALVLLREDPWAEAAFVLAARWARFKGPL